MREANGEYRSATEEVQRLKGEVDELVRLVSEGEEAGQSMVG